MVMKHKGVKTSWKYACLFQYKAKMKTFPYYKKFAQWHSSWRRYRLHVANMHMNLVTYKYGTKTNKMRYTSRKDRIVNYLCALMSLKEESQFQPHQRGDYSKGWRYQ